MGWGDAWGGVARSVQEAKFEIWAMMMRRAEPPTSRLQSTQSKHNKDKAA